MTTIDIQNQFILHCERKGLSPNTIRAYEQDISDFQATAKKSTVQDLLTRPKILDWLTQLRDRNLAPASIKRRLACLRVLCRWLEQEDGDFENPFHGLRLSIRQPRTLPKNLSQNDLRVLLGATQISDSPKHPANFSAMTLNLALELLFATGIRVGELCSITMDDFDPNIETITIHGKGSRERKVYISDQELKDLIQRYKVRRMSYQPKSDIFLITSRRTPCTPDYIRRCIHKLTARIGLEKRVTPHMFRHTTATQLVENGVDICFVQKLLGHSSISTTEIYTHVSDRSLRAAISNANLRRQIG